MRLAPPFLLSLRRADGRVLCDDYRQEHEGAGEKIGSLLRSCERLVGRRLFHLECQRLVAWGIREGLISRPLSTLAQIAALMEIQKANKPPKNVNEFTPF